MFVEISSTIIMAGVAGYSYLKTNGPTTNDGEKIQRIFSNSGWTINEKGKTKKVCIHRKRKIEGGTEYVLQLPLGMSSKDIIEKKHVLEDGLNIRSKYIDFDPRELLKIKWDRTALKQIRDIVKNKKIARKEIALDFDGMLRIRVYNQPLANQIDWKDDFLKKKGWSVPVGCNREGMIWHDFDKLYSLIVAGTPGYGKSQFLNMIISALVMMQPDDVTFTLIDLKEGAEFKKFENLKQVKRFETDPKKVKEVLEEVEKDMSAMYRRFIKDGYSNVKEAGIKDRHFIIIDEGADIAEDAECIKLLTGIARKGRAAGFYPVYSTQYPTSRSIPIDVKRNIPTRLSFVLDSGTASSNVLDQAGAEDLPMIPGRAIYKNVRCHTVQTPYMSAGQVKQRVKPHIRIKPRKDEAYAEYSHQEKTSRKHSLKFEKV
ncbi:DNA segregation ATPase FtsK/SpoIIIE, S-DNA-T family [Halobacillus karajensis]|uniref:FtsK/SpoIIIE domain-containing protein n=1 Tax=Halobacillus karajensis TaxID=195088 RepID=UPI0008A7BE4A|nr:FtsK/SpoIIIE domain-containing protein [Halobacillus karajensis]SEH78705.1 DNA segregation ATPase FtsK/SpoIIIE, S-DNA-T family [Halobacillus karajensis]